MAMRNNTLRRLLDAGQPTIGTHVMTPSPNVVEMIGHTGLFDYVEFTAEYASFDLHDLDNFCRAAELYGLGTLIKIDQDGQRFMAQRAVGCGFQGVLFVDTRAVADAQACVRAVRPETPGSDGLHGVGARRITYGGAAGSAEYIQALKDVVVALMIEKGPAVEHLDEIMAVPGVDMVNFGPSDYSMSIGRAAPYSQVRQDPRILAVERKMIESALQHGVAPRAEIEHPDEARAYLDLGVRHFCLGTDLFILKNWWQQSGEALRKMVGA